LTLNNLREGQERSLRDVAAMTSKWGI